jgi:hypothetical protein
MAVGYEDVLDRCTLNAPQNLLRLGSRINDHGLPGARADQDITIVLEGTDFQSFQFHFFLQELSDLSLQF